MTASMETEVAAQAKPVLPRKLQVTQLLNSSAAHLSSFTAYRGMVLMTFSKRPPLCWKASSKPPFLTLSISLGMMPPASQLQAALRGRQQYGLLLRLQWL